MFSGQNKGGWCLRFGCWSGGSPEKKVVPPSLAGNHRLLRWVLAVGGSEVAKSERGFG